MGIFVQCGGPHYPVTRTAPIRPGVGLRHPLWDEKMLEMQRKWIWELNPRLEKDEVEAAVYAWLAYAEYVVRLVERK